MLLLSIAAKHARLLHLGSDEWYLDDIKEESTIQASKDAKERTLKNTSARY